jgi:hypothetical protein
MPHVIVSKETKKQLMEAAASQQGIEPWMFPFIAHDTAFQAELFRTAEDLKNWRFLASLSDFRAAQRKASVASTSDALEYETGRAPRPPKPAPYRAAKRRPAGRVRSALRPKRPYRPPLNPATLPAHLVLQVRAGDFTTCPRCRLRLLKKVLRDHLEMSCPHRGRVEGRPVGPQPGGKKNSAFVYKEFV